MNEIRFPAVIGLPVDRFTDK